MNRYLLGGIVLALALALVAELVPTDPWAWSALWAPLAAGLAVLLVLRGLRHPDAPTRGGRGPLKSTVIALLVMAIVHALLPQWGLVQAYEGDAARMEIIATTFLVLGGLVVVILATDESSSRG